MEPISRGRKFTSRGSSSRRLLVFGIVLLLGDTLFRGHYWIGAFVLTAILAGGAVYLLKRGTALLSPTKLKPEQTLATLRRHDHG
jgi:hypothetical protein